MRCRPFAFSGGIATVMLAALGALAQTGSDLPEKLGLTAAEAKTSILESLGSGSVYSEPAFKAFKLMTPETRAAVVRSGLAWVKAYAATAEFKAEYAKYRESHKPEAPAARLSAEAEMKKQRQEMEKQIAEMRKSMEGLDAQTRKAMEEAIKAVQAQMEAMEKDPEQKAILKQALEMQAAQDKEDYDNRLKEWEEEFPADARRLIVRRIAEFLQESEDVAFDAKLIKSGSKMKFAETVYEDKPALWKLCYRAGKEAVEAARAFAAAWRAELEK
jgi:flagellar biosynthesis GTPase FlhF